MHALVCPLCRIALAPTDPVCPRDGRQGREVPWLSVPYALSQRFLALEPFAHGESGSLYIADDPETGRRGLLKVLAPVAKEQHAERQRLRRELVKQATLARNHLLVPYASGDSEGFTWVFREWLDGVSLEVRLSREGALQQVEALAIAAQVATALDELHRGGLLHRDVKPGHIFLQHTGHGLPRVQLLDAGIASAISARGGPPLYGTPGYVAPEQLLGTLVSFRSDLYALGCVLYRMLTGRSAFEGETDADRLEAQRVGPVPPLPPTLPPGIRQLLQSLLAREPQERPFSAQKLRRTLEPFLPDGALIEKQPTTSFELLPQRGAPAAQPSGTLRPPAPSPRSAGASGTMLGISAPAPRIDDTTHPLDLSQVEEELQARSRPPPAPAVGHDLDPHARMSEKTQPIRLDQILAVADGRRSVTRPPALIEPQRDTEPEPEPMSVIVPPSSETRVPAGVGETSESAPLFADPTGRSTLRGIVADQPPHASGPADSSEQTLEVERAQREVEPGKRTLVGIGISSLTQQPQPPPNETFARDPVVSAPPVVTSVPSAASVEPDPGASFRDSPPAQEPAAASDRAPRPRQRDIETEPMPVVSEPAERRRMLMYASAALVALAVVGVCLAALLSGNSEPTATVREPEQSPPPLPVVTEVAREPEAASEPPEEVARRASAATPQPVPRRAAPGEPVARPAAKVEPVAKKAPAREPKPTKPAATRAAKPPPTKDSPPQKPAAPETKVDNAALFAEAREQARVAYAAKRYKDAAAAYERAARYDPGHAGTYAGLGAARLQLGDDVGAVQAYQRAVQLSPTTAGFHAALGRAYLTAGDQARARSAYKQALALDPAHEAAKAALEKL